MHADDTCYVELPTRTVNCPVFKIFVRVSK